MGRRAQSNGLKPSRWKSGEGRGRYRYPSPPSARTGQQKQVKRGR